MKNILTFLIFVLTLFFSLNAKSQNTGRYPYLRERLAQAKINEIQLGLKLDQATLDRFRPVYLKYERDMSSIDFRLMAKLLRVNPDSLSASEAEKLITDQMKSAKRIINLREKYNSEFHQVLTPQQIIKLYQIEAEIRKKVSAEMKRRLISRSGQNYIPGSGTKLPTSIPE